ncbi:MAG: mechanosensitive ion channel family protein [Longimicrobiales bacterium]
MTLQLQTEIADSVQTVARNAWSELIDWRDYVPQMVKVAIIIAFALLVYRILKLLITRLVRRNIEEDDPVVKRLREQRAQTIGSLLANVALIVVVTVTALTVLGTFMDIGPILASVGVLGLAVSFGAQALVKDVISGTFMLLEGQFGIGDVVRVGDISGLVEKITLRTTILRDERGAVHVIPNGSIERVSNLTKTWSRAVLDIGIAYREDVDAVIAVLKDVGEEFHGDVEWSALLVEPPEVLGVQELGASAVVIRVMAKTLPLKQWEVARELRRRIKKRFDADGIEIPFPHVSFYWGENQLPPALAQAGAADHGDARSETV